MSKKAEKTSVEKLTEELLINRKNGFMDVTDEQVKKADKFCEGYKTFLNKAKTEREAVFETIAYAEKNGISVNALIAQAIESYTGIPMSKD